METKVAVYKAKYLKPAPIFIFHPNVVELNPEEMAEIVEFNRKLNANNRPGQLNENTKREVRTFKCLDCGQVWQQNIHAPLLMTQAELNHYYPQANKCSILK